MQIMLRSKITVLFTMLGLLLAIPAVAIAADINKTFSVDSTQAGWQDTGVFLPAGDRVVIDGSGTVDLDRNSPNFDNTAPDGVSPPNITNDPNYLAPNLNQGALIGKIGSGEPFLVGDLKTIDSVASSGELYLAVNDGGYADNEGSFTADITVTPVNDAPSFTAGPNQTVAEDSGPHSLVWATDVSAGPADESGQNLTFQVSNTNNSLFSAQPRIAPDGTLRYTPAPNANGSATVSVTLEDDGGTANGGADTSATKTFTITVTPVNDAPTCEDRDLRTLEDSDVSASPRCSDVDGDTLTYSISSQPDHGSASLVDGRLVYDPDPDYSGTDSFAYRASDGSALGSAATVSVDVAAVNDQPTLGVARAGSCGTDGRSGTILLGVSDLDTSPSALGLSASSSDPTLVSNTNISFSGSGEDRTMTVRPAAGQSGTANIKVVLSDGALTSTRTVTVKVGTNGTDAINGTARADMLFGLDGIDALNGLGSNDLLCGGRGVDAMNGNGGDDALFGRAGNDALKGGMGQDHLFGELGKDELHGDGGADVMSGGWDGDSFSGGSGADTATDFNAAEGDTKDNTVETF